MNKLDEIINDFQSLDEDFRLELLLDYAENLPELPEKYRESRDAESNRVEECQTPVYLFSEFQDGRVRLYADVPRESPTVRGLVSILLKACNDATPEEISNIPPDLLQKLGLAHQIGMMRIRGLSAIIHRIKSEASQLTPK